VFLAPFLARFLARFLAWLLAWLLAGDAAGIFPTGRGYYCEKVDTIGRQQIEHHEDPPSRAIALTLLARDPASRPRTPQGGPASGEAA